MIAALVTGSILRGAESHVSKNGKQFASATIRVKGGDGSQFVRIVAFSESAQAELLRLRDGDALSMQGQLKESIYTIADGNAKVSLSIVANCVLPLRQPPRERKAATAAPDTRSRAERCAGTWTSENGDPSDEIGFGGGAP